MRIFAPLLLVFLILAGCDRAPQETSSRESRPTAEPQTIEAPEEQWPQALMEEAQRSHTALQGTMDGLTQAIEHFLAEPGNDTHKAARDAWRQAHQAYKAVRFYQFLDLTAPATAKKAAPTPHPLLSRLDLHPMEPGYLDSVEGYPFSGLVFSESVPLTLESLNEQHQFSDTAYVVFGFHPIEFLLWGENRNQQTRRSWHDFQPPPKAAGDQPLNEQSTAKLRRRQLLSVITQTLGQDIATLVQAWQEPKNGYANQFLKLSPKKQRSQVQQALIRILKEEINAPLEAAQAAIKRREAQLLESAFSQNTAGDLQATLGSLKPILTARPAADGKSALPLTEEQQNTAAELYQQLWDEIAQLKGPLVDPLTPSPIDHLERLRQAQLLTGKLLELVNSVKP